MPGRRTFLAGMLATGLIPKTTWADIGTPAFLTAGKTRDGTYVLCGLTKEAQIAFMRPLPARGHAAAAHPSLAEAVVFARRPGDFALVLNCATGRQNARLTAPEGRHFYGHGTYSRDGSLLFTTENDYAQARGMVGIWDVAQGYRRVGEVSSGGVGPHDIKLMPAGDQLVVANGGIETHPETGRAKLNIPTMRSNLSFMDLEGRVTHRLELEQAHQKNSIRHLAVAQDGTVAFAMQWQGDLATDLPLLGLYKQGAGALGFAEDASVRNMAGYLGSVAFDAPGQRVATTSPRSGKVQVFHKTRLISEEALEDVCGVAARDGAFVVTTGTGEAKRMSMQPVSHPVAWDNHLVPI